MQVESSIWSDHRDYNALVRLLSTLSIGMHINWYRFHNIDNDNNNNIIIIILYYYAYYFNIIQWIDRPC